MNIRQGSLRMILHAGLIIILSFLIYNNSVGGRFVLDDRALIEDNKFIRSLSAPVDIFRKYLIKASYSETSSFRPMVMFSYALNYRLWGFDPRGYHITNNLLHAAVCVSFYLFIFALFGHATLALWASLFFCVLPVHAEAVAYISGRNELLCALFLLWAFIFYLKHCACQKSIYSFLVLFFFSAALMSKESALVLPFLLVVYHLVFRKKILKSFFLFVWALVFVGALLWLFLMRSGPVQVPALKIAFQGVPVFFASLPVYLRLLILPFDLRLGYAHQDFGWFDPLVLCGIAVFFVLARLFLKYRGSSLLVSFSIGWFLAALLPVSNLYPLPFFVTEHWLYVPSMGFALVLAYFVTRQGPADALKKFLFGSLLLFYAVLTIQQNDYWVDPVRFNLKTLAYRPQSPILYLDLGRSYEERGQKDLALTAYQKAVVLTPVYAKAHHAIALLHQNSGNATLAVDVYLKALRADPRNVASYNNLAALYARSGERQKAIEVLNKLLEIVPTSAIGHYNLGNLYFDMEHYPEAIEHYEKAVFFQPGYGKAYANLAVVYFRLGRYELSRNAYLKALKSGARNPELQEALVSIGTRRR